MSQTDGFLVNDIAHYQDIFSEYGIDISDVNPDDRAEQITAEQLDQLLEAELTEDAEHQLEYWIKQDRAYEAIGMIEADGPGIGVDGRIRKEYLKNARKNDPFITLVKSNRDRIVAQLEAANIDISAVPNRDQDIQAIDNLNKYKESIFSNANFSFQKYQAVVDAVTFGSGLMMCEYTDSLSSPDISRLIELGQTKGLTVDQLIMLQKASFSHNLEYVSTFEFIRDRFAKGPTSSNYNSPTHRWIHRVRQIPLTSAKKWYPNVDGPIAEMISSHFLDLNPNGHVMERVTNTVTEKTSWIRFEITEPTMIKVVDPNGGDEPYEFELSVDRYAVAKVTRLEGIGVVDIDIDEYNHNRFPIASFVYVPSSKHSCGIGAVKFGRDAQVIHNKLHNAMLTMFDTMAKGGGFIDSRLGITQEQLKARSKEGSFLVVKMPDHLQGKSLKDMVVDNRMGSFPSAYPELLQFHSSSVDTSMNVPNASKGFAQGSSGRQELVLQQQAEAVQSVTISQLERFMKELATLLYSNIVQFDQDPFVFYHTDPLTGKRDTVPMNMPSGYKPFFNEETGQTDLMPFGVINDISSVSYQIYVTTRSIVPTNPVDKANFYMNLFASTERSIKDPDTRIWLRHMNKNGFKIPGIENALDEIEQRQAQEMQQMQQMHQQAAEQGQLQSDRDFAVRAADVLQKHQPQQQQQPQV